METSERIEAKRTELMKKFSSLSENKKEIAVDLINQAAFMSVTLEDLAEKITKNGTVEEYTNGEHQTGRKVSSDAKLYTALISRYSAVITKLIKLAPESKDPAFNRETPERAEFMSIERDTATSELDEEIRKKATAAYFDALKAGKITQDDYNEFMTAEEARQRAKIAAK